MIERLKQVIEKLHHLPESQQNEMAAVLSEMEGNHGESSLIHYHFNPLPQHEKISVIESLWEKISNSSEPFQSPDWHEKELLDTEQRVLSNQEEFVDWEEAKQRLLQQAK